MKYWTEELKKQSIDKKLNVIRKAEELENKINNITRRKNLIESETDNPILNNKALKYKEKAKEKSIDFNNQYNINNNIDVSKNFKVYNENSSSPFSYKNEENTPSNKYVDTSNLKDENQKAPKRLSNDEKK